MRALILPPLVMLAACVHTVPPAGTVKDTTAENGLRVAAVVLRATGGMLDDAEPRACLGLVAGGATLDAIARGLSSADSTHAAFPSYTWDPGICSAVDAVVKPLPSEAVDILNSVTVTTIAILDGVYASGKMTCRQHAYGVAGTYYARDVIVTTAATLAAPNGPQVVEARNVELTECP